MISTTDTLELDTSEAFDEIDDRLDPVLDPDLDPALDPVLDPDLDPDLDPPLDRDLDPVDPTDEEREADLEPDLEPTDFLGVLLVRSKGFRMGSAGPGGKVIPAATSSDSIKSPIEDGAAAASDLRCPRRPSLNPLSSRRRKSRS